MITTRSRRQSQDPCPPKPNTEDTIMEENENYTDETSEWVASEADTQVQKLIEQLRSEITSEVKKEIHEVEKRLEKRMEDIRAEIISKVDKDMPKSIASQVGEQLHKSRKENRTEIISVLERERITIMTDFNTIKEDIDKKLEENRKMMDSLTEQYRKDIDRMKQFQRDIQENKTSITSWQSRMNENEDRVSNLEDTVAASERVRKDLLKTTRMQEKIIHHLQDDAKMNNVRLMGINEKEGVNTNDIKRIWAEVIAENFPNLRKQSDIQVTEAYRTPNNINPTKNTPRHIIVKIPEIQLKNNILKAAREKKQVTFKGKPIRITADFSSQTMKSRRAWSRVLQVLHENNFQPRLLYPAKLSFKYEGEVKYFHNKEQLKNFMTSKPVLHNILTNILERDQNDPNSTNENRRIPPNRVTN